ncbi:MAG: MFS transporter [Chloroflexota bacterium]
MRAVRLGGLWRHGDFLMLWIGQTISQFGTQVTLLALPLTAALLLDASAFDMGLLRAAEMLPFLLIGLPAGVWVDRWARRPIMIVGDVGRAVVLFTIPAAFLVGALSMAHLYLVAFVTGTLTVFFDIAYMSYLPSLVRSDQLVDGNSKLETTYAAAQVGGPGFAGLLIQLLTAPVAILFDAVSFIVSALLLWRIGTVEPVVEKPADGAKPSMRAEVSEGLRYVLSNPLLRPIAAASATTNLFTSAMMAVAILFAVRDLGMDAGTIGLAFMLGNVGFLVGAMLAGRAAERLGLGRAIIAGAALLPVGMILFPLATPATAVPTLVIALAIVGIGMPVYNINQLSLRQALAPRRLQGRMHATMRFLVWGTMPVGSLLGGVLGEVIGLRGAIIVATAGSATGVLWILFSPVRTLREQPRQVEA